MATERDKMLRGELADISDPEIQAIFKRNKEVLKRFNLLTHYCDEYRSVLSELIPNVPESTIVSPPFFCDHGQNIVLGEGIYINYNCVFLDGGGIEIGNRTLLGPAVQIYTPQHPKNYLDRRKSVETSHKVTIGEDCWIGGGAVICPGVTIGDRAIIGAGSVVVKDIPADSVAVGNPAKVIKKAQL